MQGFLASEAAAAVALSVHPLPWGTCGKDTEYDADRLDAFGAVRTAAASATKNSTATSTMYRQPNRSMPISSTQ